MQDPSLGYSIIIKNTTVVLLVSAYFSNSCGDQQSQAQKGRSDGQRTLYALIRYHHRSFSTKWVGTSLYPTSSYPQLASSSPKPMPTIYTPSNSQDRQERLLADSSQITELLVPAVSGCLAFPASSFQKCTYVENRTDRSKILVSDGSFQPGSFENSTQSILFFDFHPRCKRNLDPVLPALSEWITCGKHTHSGRAKSTRNGDA